MARFSIRHLGLGLFILVLMGALAADAEPIRIGTNIWPGFEPLYLARELKLFPEDSVRLLQFRSGSQVMLALETASIDAGTLTMDEVVTLVSGGTSLTVVLAVDTSNGGDSIIAQPKITEMSGLRGARVAVEDTALGAYFLHRALKESGMSVTDIDATRLDITRHTAAFRRGEVAASVCYEPIRGRLLALGGKELFSSEQIPGEIIDVVVVRSEAVADFTDTLRQIGEAWDAALDYMVTDPEKAYEILGRRMGLDSEGVRHAYEGLTLLDRRASTTLLRSDEFQNGVLPQLLIFMANHALLEAPTRPTFAVESVGLDEEQRDE